VFSTCLFYDPALLDINPRVRKTGDKEMKFQLFLHGAAQLCRQVRKLFPGWHLYVYTTATSMPGTLLSQYNTLLEGLEGQDNVTIFRQDAAGWQGKMALSRFLPFTDTTIEHVVVLDLDNTLEPALATVINQWVKSSNAIMLCPPHLLCEQDSDLDLPALAGIFGVVPSKAAAYVPDVHAFITEHPTEAKDYHRDEYFLKYFLQKLPTQEGIFRFECKPIWRTPSAKGGMTSIRKLLEGLRRPVFIL
jgi:hypothetical protein